MFLRHQNQYRYEEALIYFTNNCRNNAVNGLSYSLPPFSAFSVDIYSCYIRINTLWLNNRKFQQILPPGKQLQQLAEYATKYYVEPSFGFLFFTELLYQIRAQLMNIFWTKMMQNNGL